MAVFRRWAAIGFAGVLLGTLAAVSLARHARGTLALMPLASKGMVLQRDTTVTIAGRALAGWPVVLAGTWGSVAVTRADATGAWRTTLRTGAAGGPYDLLVWAGQATAIHDVWLGETWLCSGQSNMWMPVERDDPAAIDIPGGAPIKLFRVALASADSPQVGCQGAWAPARRDTVLPFSAACWHFGRTLQAGLGVPIGLVSASASGISIEGWTSARGLAEVPELAAPPDAQRSESDDQDVSRIERWRSSLFFNAMIAPLAPYTLRGVVWYQGESNVEHAADYARLFPVMIRDWRAWFERELPFAFVQLPGFRGYRPHGAIAELRDAQRRALALPDTAMVVSIDLSDGSDIHGASKAAIGLRLASWALADLYGRRDLPVAGPLYRSMRIEPWGVQLFFDHTDGGLVAATTPLAGFEIAGADLQFHDAWAVIADDNVVVRSPQVPAPVAVRYGWDDVPVASLRNRAGLPASPFRTDDWIAAKEAATREASLAAP